MFLISKFWFIYLYMLASALFNVLALEASGVLYKAPPPPTNATKCIYPPASSISPCECQADDSYNVWLSCNWDMGEDNEEDIARFESILSKFDSYTSIYVLDITCDRCFDYQLDAIFNLNSTGRFQFTYVTLQHFEPSGILNGQIQFSQDALSGSQDSLKFLTIAPFHYIQPDPRIITEMKNLEQIRMYGIDLGAGCLPILSYAESLEFLAVSKGAFGCINAQTFNHHPKLEVIYLDQDKIATLAPMAFSNLSSLTNISLSYNNISRIEELTFHHLPQLKGLDLRHNNIKIIEDNFSGISSSVQLLLGYNKIKQVAEDSFRDLVERMLTVEDTAQPLIDLTGNPLECGCDLKWLIVDIPQAVGLFHNAVCYDTGEDMQDLDPEILNLFCPE